MDTQILWTKNENGTIDRVLGLNANTILTTNRNLAQLSDVDTTGAVEQNVLTWNGTKWVPGLPSFSALGDVLIDAGTLSSSNVIKWSPSPVNRWVNRDLGYAVLTVQGRIIDAVFNTPGSEWNVLNPANYELDGDGNTTFGITSFTNNSITVDTTTNFEVSGLVDGANYRVEWNFNYNIATSVGPFTQAVINSNIRNQSGQRAFNTNSIVPGQRTFTNSLSLVNNSSSLFRFIINNVIGSLAFTGTTPLNLNMVISITEI